MTLDEVMNKIKGHGLVQGDRAKVLYDEMNTVLHLDGDFAEVGVFKGASGMIASFVAGKKSVHLFDTFEGLPDNIHEVDYHKPGEFNANFDEVKQYFSDRNNVSIHKGVFPRDTGHTIKDKKFCFVHLDVDLYLPTLECLEFFYDQMTPGAKFVLDDYNWPHTPGVNKAIDKFLAQKPETVQGLGPCRYQALIVKK
jgi:O-methyltransferase